MKKENDKNISLPRASTSDLRGKQSVRATFRLSAEAVNALSIVAAHLGIKQKSLFDHLIEEVQCLEQITGKAVSHEMSIRIQKTYVLSRNTLNSLEKASKDFDTPRDVLVEYSIRRLLPIISEEKKKHGMRKNILNDLKDYVRHGESILEKSEKLLGKDDPVYNRLEKTMAACKSACREIESFIEKGKAIEEFD
ncbi:MAG: hypothetical protein GY795_42530 [Desulfobacterales bacterium]|nr:hypothetical protein [Desulfobacterales bacterium]